MKGLSFLLLLLSVQALAQKGPVFVIDSLPKQGIVLDQGWKWQVGDDLAWANPDFDDSNWENIDPTLDVVDSLPQILRPSGICWFRLRLKVNKRFADAHLAFGIFQSGASEIYMNGKLVREYGTVSANPDQIQAYDPLKEKPIPLYIPQDSTIVLAVRYTLQPNITYTLTLARQNPALKIICNYLDVFHAEKIASSSRIQHSLVFRIGAFSILFIVYFALYLYYPTQKTNLFFCLASLSVIIADVASMLVFGNHKVGNLYFLFNLSFAFTNFRTVFILIAVYFLLEQKRNWFFWALIILSFLIYFPALFFYHWGILWPVLFGNLINLEIVRITLKSIQSHKKGAWIIAVGGLSFFAFWLIFFLSLYFNFIFTTLFGSIYTIGDFTYNLSLLSIPVAVSIYSGMEVAFTNRSLQLKLTEVEVLSVEKQKILSDQNRILERQVAERTAELSSKNQELEIEAALERVRARTLSMQVSNEVLNVAATLYDELQKLDFTFGIIGINFIDGGTGDMETWVAGFGQDNYPKSYNIPYFDHPYQKSVIEAWRNGTPYLVYELTGTEKKDYDDFMFTHSDYRTMPEDVKARMIATESVTFSLAYMKYGVLFWGAATPLSIPLPEVKAQIFRRFAKVFEQVYTRFLDLQKAEAQAREAQIEAALERVRSRTMAMQKSIELSDVVAVIFQEKQNLGFSLNLSNIVLFDENTMEADYWLSNQNNSIAAQNYHIPYFEHPLYQYQLNSWKNAIPFAEFVLTAESKRSWDEILMTKTDIKNIPASTLEMMTKIDTLILSSVAIKYGLLQVIGTTQLSEELVAILKRLAKVFEQTYTRFLDLQKAEQQAREAIIEASLERVRAEIASMRNPEDLQRITPLIWKELIILNVPFILCGVFIMDEDAQKVHTYLSTPEGDALASFHLAFESQGITPEVVRHWRSQSIFLDQWDAHQFRAWAQSLVEQGLLQSSESYLTLAPPPHLYLHFVPFLQGMLYVGNHASLDQTQVQVVQQLANAFSTAYARYQDFNLLEAAKLEVENTLHALKSTQAQLIQSEKLASLGELTAGIAHEIQNPLNFVNNFAEVSAEMLDEMHEELEKGDTTEAIAIASDLKTNLQKINHHGQRASSIVKGMLEHSRASNGVKELTDLNALADEYLRLAYHGLRAKDNNFNAILETHFDPDLPKVSVIPQDIGRVLLNLINNAFYAVDEKQKQMTRVESGTPLSESFRLSERYTPTISLRTKRLDNAVEISIKDNGNGIPEAIKDKIFQPFFTTKPTGQGTGLGLSLAYDIVKAHGGTLEVVSIPNESTSFIISIPS